MSQYVILAAVGADRPGLVDEVSEFILERGGNIENSRMLNLRGQFAMMVLVAGSDSALARVRSEVWQLSQGSGLQAEVRPAQPERVAASALASGGAYRLRATALDQPGLVHHIAHFLRGVDVNIESLETRLTPAPISGAPMFAMELVISVPPAMALEKLREELGRVCDELNIDWELTADE